MHSKVAAFHISMIPQRWYKNHLQDQLIPEKESAIFSYNMGIFNDEENLPMRKPTTIPKTVHMVKNSIHKRNLYGRIWGLAREATLLAVEQNDNEIVPYLQAYINRSRNKNHHVHENPTNDEIDETSDNSQTNETNETSDESEESEAEDQDINGTDLINVKNPTEDLKVEDLKVVEGHINAAFAVEWATMQLFTRIKTIKTA
ncbi:hypothetical protein C2G38_2212012 [Gigaspora rosea]|uniref:Uncharacterized protein n=1 Tax=Gigaspora rosea TaxID=44941 RepID=A0A397UHN3_9GLOM|nr:hypothetical protein C2G38_2212012 [Gigaspora rosea]